MADPNWRQANLRKAQAARKLRMLRRLAQELRDAGWRVEEPSLIEQEEKTMSSSAGES
jgi:predicted secreted protein